MPGSETKKARDRERMKRIRIRDRVKIAAFRQQEILIQNLASSIDSHRWVWDTLPYAVQRAVGVLVDSYTLGSPPVENEMDISSIVRYRCFPGLNSAAHVPSETGEWVKWDDIKFGVLGPIVAGGHDGRDT